MYINRVVCLNISTMVYMLVYIRKFENVADKCIDVCTYIREVQAFPKGTLFQVQLLACTQTH